MGVISNAVAICNNEVAQIAWDVDGMIEGCLGFDIVRVYPSTGEERALASWVPFEGQDNEGWKEQDTGVWPVQKLGWRDLTLRRRRDQAERRPANMRVKYRIRPVGLMAAGLEPVPVRVEKTYTGSLVPLAYLGPAAETNEVVVGTAHGDIRAAFNNGILSGQWLRRALESTGKPFNEETLNKEVSTPGSAIRTYLFGDVYDFLSDLLGRAASSGGHVYLALYELDDPELVGLLIENKERVSVILSNSSADRESHLWDARNQPARQSLAAAGVSVQNRLFNNRHIGHNKFAVYVGPDQLPRVVMSGSTNWTSLGLCGQSNNCIILESADAAGAYWRYWKRLAEDVIVDPSPPTAPGKGNVQGQALRQANEQPGLVGLETGAASLWFAPNTKATTRNIHAIPPDLNEVFALMRDARRAIFFLAFLPSRGGLYSIIEEARSAGESNPDLLVVGAISDPTAMPGYRSRTPEDGDEGDETPDEAAARKPYVYDERHTHIVRAASLGEGTAMGNFEAEILKLGTAVVHDKIVVIDPLSEHCVVVTGSHNLGYKASYENDENLIVIRGNRSLAEAYLVHVLDVYDHYRFRAWQKSNKLAGKPVFSGHIDLNDRWLKRYLTGSRGDIDRYLLSAEGQHHI